MKVTSALLTSMSGSIGGATASRARGDVQYFRKRITPSNPRTLLQTAIRAAVASAASRWRSILNEAQREVWWDAATGGQTGSTLYAKVNQPRIYAVNSTRITDMGDPTTVTPLDVPPSAFSTSLVSDGVSIDDSANSLTLKGIDPTSDCFVGGRVEIDATHPALIFVYASHEQSPSRLSRQHPYQLVQCLSCDAAQTGDITLPLAALGFTTITGQVMYTKVIAQRPDGALTIPIESRVTIVA